MTTCRCSLTIILSKMEDNKNLDKKRGNRLVDLWAGIGRLKLYAVLALVLLAIVSMAYLARSCRDNSITSVVNDKINITPTQVAAMREIGEWEFLSIEDEEMIDTVRKGIFKDDELIRIYSGTLRLGIDLSEAKDDWVKLDGDTLLVVLPRVKLLDDDFIDEAKTQSFFETGTWSDKAREDMYHRAAVKMKRRCLTKENVESAENNAMRQFDRMFMAMGFDYVKIRFCN